MNNYLEHRHTTYLAVEVLVVLKKKPLNLGSAPPSFSGNKFNNEFQMASPASGKRSHDTVSPTLCNSEHSPRNKKTKPPLEISASISDQPQSSLQPNIQNSSDSPNSDRAPSSIAS